MKGWIRKAVAHYVHATGRGSSFYRRFCKPSGLEWGLPCPLGQLPLGRQQLLCQYRLQVPRPFAGSHRQQCGLSDCTLIGHDGVVLLIEHRFGKHLDSVGFIDIKDNCFIGHGAIVMPASPSGLSRSWPPVPW